MPRRKKGPRLWLRPTRRDANGSITRPATWVILDGADQFATGCAAPEAELAEQRLSAHIESKYRPSRRERDIEQIEIADVLSIYDEDRGPKQSDRVKFDGRLSRLNEFWGGKMLSEVTGETCREYAAQRGSEGGARRDLEDLRAAINHHGKEGFHRGAVRVTLPRKGVPRERWLTRKEVARLLRVCRSHRETQTVHRGAAKGQKIVTEKRPLVHLVPLILIGIYTGTRPGAILKASFSKAPGHAFVDVENGLFYRLGEGERETVRSCRDLNAVGVNVAERASRLELQVVGRHGQGGRPRRGLCRPLTLHSPEHYQADLKGAAGVKQLLVGRAHPALRRPSEPALAQR